MILSHTQPLVFEQIRLNVDNIRYCKKTVIEPVETVNKTIYGYLKDKINVDSSIHTAFGKRSLQKKAIKTKKKKAKS